MITDPNWLYSTIAQSSAAIVAIIGGFITATILGLIAEKRTLKNRLAKMMFYLNNEAEYPLLDMRSVKYEKTDVESQIESFSYPPNLKWGIVVLAFLAVFGILIPVLIMASEAFFLWTKLLTLITFCLGLIGVFGYVVFQIRVLKK